MFNVFLYKNYLRLVKEKFYNKTLIVHSQQVSQKGCSIWCTSLLFQHIQKTQSYLHIYTMIQDNTQRLLSELKALYIHHKSKNIADDIKEKREISWHVFYTGIVTHDDPFLFCLNCSKSSHEVDKNMYGSAASYKDLKVKSNITTKHKKNLCLSHERYNALYNPQSHRSVLCSKLSYNKIVKRSYSSSYTISHKNILCYTFKTFIHKRFTGSKKVIDAAKKGITEMQKVGPSSQIQHTEMSPCMIKPDYSVLSYTPITTLQQSTSVPTPVQLEGGTDPNYQPKILSEDAQEKRPDLFTPQPPVQTEQVNEVPKVLPPYSFGLSPGLGSAAQANIRVSTPSPIRNDSDIDLQSTFFEQETTIFDAPLLQPELPSVPSELSVPLDSPAQDVAPSIEIENPVLSISDQISTPSVELVELPAHLPIPVPPPMPPQPQPEPSTEKLSVDHKNDLIEQIKKLAEGKKDDDNFRPSELPDSEKGFYSFPPKPVAIHIDPQQLKQEMLSRNLVKDDPKPLTTDVLLENGSMAVVGESKHKVKLSPLGIAYYEKVQRDHALEKPNTQEAPGGDPKTLKFIIIVPPTNDDALFIEAGQQKHMLVANNTQTGEYYAMCYLTSKNSGYLISEQQFKTFQNQKEEASETGQQPGTKKQRMVTFETAKKIDPKDIQIVKWGEEYIENLAPDVKEQLALFWKDLSAIPYEYFNKNGITKEEGIKMCQEYDKNVQQGNKHPLSKDQMKLNGENKKSQHEKQQAKKNIPNNNDNNEKAA